jgi:hypothetical protein
MIVNGIQSSIDSYNQQNKNQEFRKKLFVPGHLKIVDRKNSDLKIHQIPVGKTTLSGKLHI